jgi:hypothetical protein
MLLTNMHKNRGCIFIREELEDTKGIRILKNKKKYK